MTNALATLETNMPVKVHPERGGLSVSVPQGQLAASPVWRLGGFAIQFVSLPALADLEVDAKTHPVYLKVMTGEVDAGGRRAFPPIGAVTSTRLEADTVHAIEDAVLCIVTDTSDAPSSITDMDQLTMQGALAEHCQWQSFEEKFAAVTDIFNGLEAYMVPGFHLLDEAGEEIAYVHFWTTGQGVDVSTHNHGQDPSPQAPAFAEVHLVLRNGTGAGAMYQCDAPDATERVRTPIQTGEEHGPFFHIDNATGAPKLRPNGAVDYPWHGWQGGQNGTSGQVYDLVAAFEISPNYARI